MIPKNTKNSHPLFAPYLALASGILFLSISPLFVRWADAPGVVTSFYRMLIVSVIMGTLTLFHKKNNLPQTIPARIWILPVLAGLASGIDHIFWSIAIGNTLVANVTLLNYIAPLWVSLTAILILREKYAWHFWAALAAVLLGSWMFFSSQMDFSSQFSLTGEGFAFFSSFFFASYMILSQSSQPFFKVRTILLISSFAALIPLLMTILLMGLPLTGYSPQTYVTFLLAGLFSQLGGYYSINFALRHLPATVVSSAFVLQPVITVLLAAQFEDEGIYIIQILGGVLILGGIYFIKKAKK